MVLFADMHFVCWFLGHPLVFVCNNNYCCCVAHTTLIDCICTLQCAAAVDVHIGSYLDPEETQGLAHFLGRDFFLSISLSLFLVVNLVGSVFAFQNLASNNNNNNNNKQC